MKFCTFCGNSGESEEHIISKSVQQKAKLSAFEIEVGVRTENGDGEFRKAHLLNSFVTRKICKLCNEGWMSQLEMDFISAVGPLIEPIWPRLEHEFLSKALKYHTVIARWAVKTAITANLAGTLKRTIPNEIARSVWEGKLLPSLTVKVAYIRNFDPFNMIINRGFWFEDGLNKRWRGATSGRSFDVLFQFNHLAIRAINAPGVQLGYESPERALPLAIFPVPGNPHHSGFRFETLNDFEKILWARTPRETQQS